MPAFKTDNVTDDVQEIPRKDQLKALDSEARRHLNMSGQEFAQKWNNGEFRDNTDPVVTRIAMLLPDAW